MPRFRWPAIVHTGTLVLALCFGDAARAQPVSYEELIVAGPLGDRTLGNSLAAVTLIEYANLTCSSCISFREKIYPLLKSRYVDTGKVYFIFRETVLPSSPYKVFDQAGFALARCAGEDRYFAVVDALHKERDQWMVEKPLPPLLALAKNSGFTDKTFEDCLLDAKIQDHFAWVEQRAEKQLGLDEVPTFYIAVRATKTGLRVARSFDSSRMDEWDKLFKRYLKQ